MDVGTYFGLNTLLKVTEMHSEVDNYFRMVYSVLHF